MKVATLPRIQRRRLQTSTSPSTKSLPLPRGTSFRNLFKSPTPANGFATLTNSCACHTFWNVSKSLRLPREKHFEPQKVVRDPGVLTILTSKSFTRRRGANFSDFNFQKYSEDLVFNDFDFQIVLARRRGAYFGNFNFKNAPNLLVFSDFDFQIVRAHRWGANFVTSWATDPPHPLVLRSWLFEPAKPQNYGKTQHFAHFLPAKSSCLTSLLYHICAITSLDWQIFSSNFQYSRKLDS